MFTRLFISIMVLLISACVPVPGRDVLQVEIANASPNQEVRDELEPILRAMLSGIITDQLARLQYAYIPCADMDGLGGPPRCMEGVAEGTIVEVLPLLGTEGSFATSESMENIFNNFMVKNLYSVYRVTPGPNDDPNYPIGEYAMLFDRDLNDTPVPVVLRVTDGRIVRMDFHIGIPVADMLKDIPVDQVIITPSEAKAWTEDVRAELHIPAETP